MAEISWGGARIHDRFTFRPLSWPGMVEGQDLWHVTGGSAAMGAFTDLKASGSIDFKGGAAPSGVIRVYYSFTDENGEEWEHPVITGWLEDAETDMDGALFSGSANVSGMLCLLLDDGYGRPYTVPAGTYAVAKACQIAEDLKLRVDADGSDYATTSSKTFDADASYLEVVNWLLGAAGFAGATTDEWGTVLMHRYIEPSERDALRTFTDGEDGAHVMTPVVRKSSNAAEIPNVVRLWYEDDERGLFAEAVNDDPDDPASTANRGRVVCLRDVVDELPGADTAAMLSALKAKARDRLVDNSTGIEYAEVDGLFVPEGVNDAMAIRYGAAGYELRGACTNKDVDFEPGAPTHFKVRRLMRPDFEPKVEGRVEWEA